MEMRKALTALLNLAQAHKNISKIALVSAIVISVFGLVFANQRSTSVKVSWTVLPFQELRISGSSPQGSSVTTTYAVPEPTSIDIGRGYMEEMNSVSLTVNSNIPWKVQVWTESQSMGESKDGLLRKPVSDFELREHGATYFSITNTPQILACGQRGSYEIGVDHRILLEEDCHAGNYRLEVVYTIMPK